MTQANKSVEPNHRRASPIKTRRQLGSASCAPPSLSAAVARPCRYSMAEITGAGLQTLGIIARVYEYLAHATD